MKPIALVAVTLALVLMPACSKTNVEKSVIPVVVRAAEPYKAGAVVRYSANVQPYTSVNVEFKVAGYVTEILQVRGADGRVRNVQDGDVVKKGAVLARLRQTEFIDRVNQAKARLAESGAELEKAKQDFERASALFSTQSLTKPDYDGAKARNDAALAKQDGATATLQQAELEQRDSFLRAPADGVLLKRAIEVGSLVGPGTLGFVLADTSAVKVVFGVPDLMVASIKPGAPLSITTEALPEAEIPGRITRISPAADKQTRLFEVELTVPNPHNRLKVGMIAALSVPAAKAPEELLVVPLTSVIRPKKAPEAYGVYVIDESGGKQLARLRMVRVGEVYGNQIAVTEGIRPGEQVISSGAMLLTDGDAVRPVTQVVPQ